MAENTFAVTTEKKRELTVTDMMVSRQAQEVQAAMIIAKRFPRDEALSFDKIMRACKRKGLAQQAEYTYPRGGTKVNGPSIRLAETIAQGWGNLDYGIIELEQKKGSSEMMAYAWDLETNARVTKIFSVKHVRDTRNGSYDLKDGRDIYEATANFGARRVRACILSVVPGDVIDSAIDECRNTLKGAYEEPLADRFRKIIALFESEFMVSKEQVEEYLGYSVSSVSENDYVRMQGVYRSLRDGMSSVKDFFKVKEVVKDPFTTEKEKEPDLPEKPQPAENSSDSILKVQAEIEKYLVSKKKNASLIYKYSIDFYEKKVHELNLKEMQELKKKIEGGTG